MHSLLNRIEREYILKSLAEKLPALTLQQGSLFRTTNAGIYRVSGETIEFPPGTDTSGLINMPVCVQFRHMDCGMFFDSVFSQVADSSFLNISPSVYRVVEDSQTETACRMVLGISDPPLVAHGSSRFPLDDVFIDPENFSLHESSLEKILDKFNLAVTAQRNSPLSYRLFDYIDSFRNVEKKNRFAATLVYVDSGLALVSIPKTMFDQLHKDDAVASTIWYVNRRIDCTSKIIGRISINRDAGILLLDISSAQVEDKRFLHERLFRIKYLG